MTRKASFLVSVSASSLSQAVVAQGATNATSANVTLKQDKNCTSTSMKMAAALGRSVASSPWKKDRREAGSEEETNDSRKQGTPEDAQGEARIGRVWREGEIRPKAPQKQTWTQQELFWWGT